MEKLRVRELMTSDVVTVSVDDDLATVHELMSDNDIRHLPVVDGEAGIVGIISQRDLVATALYGEQDLPVTELLQLLRNMSVREIMVTGVETVEPEETIEEAGRTMLDSKLGCLPVCEGEHLVGILTEADFVRHLVAREAKHKDKRPARLLRVS